MMTTCERSRTKAYSSDIRWRVVWQHVGLLKPVTEIASNLGIDKSTVYRTLVTVIELFFITERLVT